MDKKKSFRQVCSNELIEMLYGLQNKAIRTNNKNIIEWANKIKMWRKKEAKTKQNINDVEMIWKQFYNLVKELKYI